MKSLVQVCTYNLANRHKLTKYHISFCVIWISLFSILSILCGCQSSKDAKYVSLEDVKYIKDFPYNEELKEIPINVDEIGLLGIRVVGDSLLVLGYGSSWSVHSIDGKKSYGHFLSIGQGPEDFVYMPYVGVGAFSTIQDSLWGYIPDQFNERIVSFNMTEFIESGNQKMLATPSKFLGGDTKWSVTPCGADSYHMLVPFDDFRGLKRMYVIGDSIKEVPNTQSLSRFTVAESVNELNLLSAIIRYSPETDKFIEAMIFLNQINVYSSDGKFAMTICVGKKLDDLNRIENAIRQSRGSTYKGAAVNALGFCAIYSGHTMNPIESQNTEIQFFNWDNEPIYRLKQPFEASAVDLDITHKRLWVVDKNEDVLRCYDATPIVKAYEEKALPQS